MGLKVDITEEQFLDDEEAFERAAMEVAEDEEMEYFMREEAEKDERERYWAEEAHKLMHEQEEDNG